MGGVCAWAITTYLLGKHYLLAICISKGGVSARVLREALVLIGPVEELARMTIRSVGGGWAGPTEPTWVLRLPGRLAA